MKTRVVAITLLVFIAGCSAGGASSSPTDTTQTTTATTIAESTDTSTTTTTPTTTTSTTTRTTTEVPPENPWQADTIFVGLQHYNKSNVPERYETALRDTVEYWNENASKYSSFEEIDFAVNVNSTDPDVRVAIVENINQCGGEYNETFVGCAPLYEDGAVETHESYVRIEAGYTEESTRQTMRHEFGHLLGLEHGEEPMPTMAERFETVKQSAPNATERAYPWESENLTVAITGSPTQQQRQQIDTALEYFEDGADGLLDETQPTFEVTDDPSSADIVIEASTNGWECGEEYEGGSCGAVYGHNEDTDAALEYHSELNITLAGTRSDTTAWHTAYWLAYGFGATAEEMPEPLDGEADDRGGRWWT